jgi:hypothetical protein
MTQFTQYITKEGDSWDGISQKAWAKATLFPDLLADNVAVPGYTILPAGILLRIAIKEITGITVPPELLPPWKRTEVVVTPFIPANLTQSSNAMQIIIQTAPSGINTVEFLTAIGVQTYSVASRIQLAILVGKTIKALWAGNVKLDNLRGIGTDYTFQPSTGSITFAATITKASKVFIIFS